MKPKSIILGSLLLSLVGFGVGYFVLHLNIEASISGYALVKYSKALFYGMGALAVVFLALLFTQKAFSVWWKFGVWFIPLAALLFIFYPEGGAMDLAWPFPETVFQWVSGLYVAVSAGIIASAAAKNTF
jgi:hypothetical protein